MNTYEALMIILAIAGLIVSILNMKNKSPAKQRVYSLRLTGLEPARLPNGT